MTVASSAPPVLATEAQVTPSYRGWIHSRTFDLGFFLLSPLAGLVIIMSESLMIGPAVVAVSLYLIAIPHYLSSFTFYLGDENLSYYKHRWVAFFAGPLVIVALYAGALVGGYARIVQSTLFVWNVYHVARQSSGIMSIYRRLNLGPAEESAVTQVAILATNATMAFWFLHRFPPLYELLLRVHPLAPWALPAMAFPIAIGSLTILAFRIARRSRRISGAELGFLATSLLLFHPYLWVHNSDLATFAMLMGHFVQYLGIVWLLNHRKYQRPSGSLRQRTLSWMSANPLRIIGAACMAGFLFYVFDEGTARAGVHRLYLIAWNLLALLHFYTDGLVWAFKRPFVRRTVGPHLTLESHMA